MNRGKLLDPLQMHQEIIYSAQSNGQYIDNFQLVALNLLSERRLENEYRKIVSVVDDIFHP